MGTIIYILTNEAMPDYIKIGKTDKDPVQRAKELFSSGVPLPFEVFYAKKVKTKEQNIEKKIHEIFDDYNENPKREFFTVDPEKAKTLLELLDGEEVVINESAVEDEIDKKIIERKKSKKVNFNFKLADIPIGAELKFTRDPTKAVIVKSEKNIVELDGEEISLSKAALQLLHEAGVEWRAARGASYFLYEDETLEERRKRLESD